MVAFAYPPRVSAPPRQLYLLPPPAASEADVLRLLWFLNRAALGDALLCGGYALERQRFEQIEDIEDDHAPDATLVTGSYVEWALLYQERIVGVVEVRVQTASKRQATLRQMARVLLSRYDWRVDQVRYVRYGAIVDANTTLERVPRLLRGEG